MSPHIVQFYGVYSYDKNHYFEGDKDMLAIVMVKAQEDLLSWVNRFYCQRRGVPEVFVWNALVQMGRALLLTHGGEGPGNDANVIAVGRRAGSRSCTGV
jgi:hypothetical protein